MTRTKIVCTIGPATSSPDMLAQLIQAGMDVARINFSHGDQATHAEVIQRIRHLAAEMDSPVAILGDLQGPKLRIGQLPEAGVSLEAGATVKLSTQSHAADVIPFQYDELPRIVRAGDRILLDDGLLELIVLDADETSIQTRVVTGGRLTSHKGINLPRTDARIPAITDKDRADLAFAIRQNVDWIALSFVRTAQEVAELVERIRAQADEGCAPKVAAKIEKPEAVANIEAIIAQADGIMVARGDLGIEMPTEEVPMIQKAIIARCNEAGKPVITATQMLDSMLRNPRPTRAEASDVANAVLDGTDAVMLSGETAVGPYPVRAVQIMRRIVLQAERALPPLAPESDKMWTVNPASQAIAHAASNLATRLGAAAILAPTASGYTARQLSRHRPKVPIIAVTPQPMFRNQLNLCWGVTPLLAPRRQTTDQVVSDAILAAMEKRLIKAGDLIVITAGAAGSAPGTTNLLKIHLVEDVLARGLGVGIGTVHGRVRKLGLPLSSDEPFGPEDIVVASTFERSWLPQLASVGGLVSEEGVEESEAVHLAETLQIPAVVAVKGALALLEEGEVVTVNASLGLIGRGAGENVGGETATRRG